MKTPPLVVYRDGQVWRWHCRAWLCDRADHAPRQPVALARGLEHLSRHGKTGFGR